MDSEVKLNSRLRRETKCPTKKRNSVRTKKKAVNKQHPRSGRNANINIKIKVITCWRGVSEGDVL